MTKREKELQKLRNQIARLEAQREAAIRMLVKAVIDLPKMRKQEARLETTLAKRRALPIHPANIESAMLHGKTQTMGIVHDAPKPEPAPEDDDLPDFLRRGMAAQKAVDDATARAEIEAQQAAEKKRKDARRIEKIKIAQEVKDAELTGARRKMPLTGKAALAALR